MAEKVIEKSDSSMMVLVAIVAIVAVVGLVVMFKGTGSTSTPIAMSGEEANVAGEAVDGYTYWEVVSWCNRVAGRQGSSVSYSQCMDIHGYSK